MKRLFLALLGCVACASLAVGQDFPLKGYTTYLPATRIAPPDSAAEQLSTVTTVTPLPSFSYTIQASAGLHGGVFSGSIIGRSPVNRGKTTTTIPTQIIPLVITINDGTTIHTYDPTAPDTCVTGNPTDVSIITGSPIFTNNAWTMNGINIGTTQYIDAFQRAQFWSQVQGTAYHLILNQSVLASQALLFSGTGVPGSSGPGSNNNAAALFGGCGFIGVVNINDFDNAVQALITGPLAGLVNAGTFPIFLTKDVVSADPGHSLFANCCILGYHSGLFVGGNLQIYSPFSIDTSGGFGSGFVGTLAHEMGEAINDPSTNNGTPPWGNIGQVQMACQANLEVGDPLSPGFGSPTNPFVVVGANGLTYSLQELAFYSWFFGSTSLGVGSGGKFSNHGTFNGSAIFCPPGGTN
jgi:hypothetical protein